VPQFQRHGNDSGSPEVQIARMSARVLQLTEHLAEHKKDYSTRRGLLAVLSQRKQMLLYLQVRRCWAGWAGWRPAGG
jgi:small subunit ribosomal protein S15